MIHQLIDYETLRIIWWGLLGLLLIGFAIMDGFDMGVAMLLPFTARTDTQRRIVINSIAPVWEGNQVWFILGGGAIFAAWPLVYATAFSGFYGAMFLVLVALIIRPVGMKFRSKVPNPSWRSMWDFGLFIGGLVPSLVFGIAFGNIIQGVPFHFDNSLRVFYTGSFIDLFSPFSLLCGLLSTSLFTMHGATYLCLKTEDPIANRAKHAGIGAAILVILFFSAGWLWLKNGWVPGYRIMDLSGSHLPSNPLSKNVIQDTMAWLDNYSKHPWIWIGPILGFGGASLSILFLALRRPGIAFITSALAQIGVISTVGFSLFPFILPSSSHLNSSLTVWDASSSHMTLFLMLASVLIFMPLILIYTSWVFRVMRGKVTEQEIVNNKQSY
jgi:cytochrome d ubiquinol oxidase subunit II